MATNYKNSVYNVLNNDVDTFPRSVAGTGTILVKDKQVVGAGTAFLSELHIGDWIFDEGQMEIRRVTAIQSDTLATVDHAFTVDVPALTALVITPASDYVEMSFLIPPAQPDGFIDQEAYPAGTPITFTKASRDNSGIRDFIDPLILDATGTIILIMGQK